MEGKEKKGKRRRGECCVCAHCKHSVGETRGNNNTVRSRKELLGSLSPVILW